MMNREWSRTVSGLIATVAFVSVSAISAAAHSGVVEGVVKNSSGQPVTGAFVKLKNEQRRLTFMVISQAQGRYTADRLPSGKYSVQGVGSGFQSDWTAAVDVADGKTAKQDVSLTKTQAAMLAPAWPGRMPEESVANATWPDGAGKQLATQRCQACHEAGRTLARRQGKEGWEETVKGMRENMKDMGMPDMTDQDAHTLVDYLAANFPPMPQPDENSRLPRTLLRGEALKYRVVQYELQDGHAETHDIAVAPDGIGWANQRLGGKLSSFNPETYEYREFTPPAIKASKARMGNLQISKDGIVWLPENNDRRWLSFNTKSLQWTSYEVPSAIPGGAGGNSMAIAKDGLIWNTGPGLAKSLNPATKEWKHYISPTAQSSKMNPGGYGIAIAGDGKIWFAMNNVDKIARVDPVTGKVDEFNIPVQGTAYPRRMT
ncbi:MAG: carboxypeptidase regulatory-like domain-containing protein, partial [Terriglobia bacterium]